MVGDLLFRECILDEIADFRPFGWRWGFGNFRCGVKYNAQKFERSGRFVETDRFGMFKSHAQLGG